MDKNLSKIESSIEPELYFLIIKFLNNSPYKEIADALTNQIQSSKILPQRLDWKGNYHDQTFNELEKKYFHVSSNHLLQICAGIVSILKKDMPSYAPNVMSLLGTGKYSLLQCKDGFVSQSKDVVKPSPKGREGSYLRKFDSSYDYNIIYAIQNREKNGVFNRRQAIPSKFYSKMQLYRHTLGHLSAVYCVLYDRTGRYIITGADDLLVKVWSADDGRLLATFRGASSEIMDIAVNFDNTLLAAGSLDRILRVWCFQTMSPVAVLSGHSGMITSVNFCPIPCNGINYLVSTSTDGSVAFWYYTQELNERATFHPKPIQYNEKMRPGQAQMICASFSPGGAFMAAGSADHNVRVYAMLGDEGPRRVLEVEAHSDTVDSIQWSHLGLKFISGSKDGTANVWHFEQQQWMHKRLLMGTKLPGEVEVEENTNKKAKVTMVSWDVSDEWVITAVNDSSLKVWNAKSGELVKILRAHKDEVFVLEAHPINPRIILSAGHDGQLVIWDVLNPEPIACFQNFIEGQGNGAIFDAKWSPDGTMLAATDSHGHLLMYGFGSGVQKLKKIPKELFFHTDYRPLIRDANNYALDEQTQTAPHLMPPPFLVDVDGNPYPPSLQRLVPGRENCRGEQLVPNIAVGASGMQEVIEGLPDSGPRSNIDRLIEALAQRQNLSATDNENAGERDENDGEIPVRQIVSPRGNRSGLRRVGNVEGVRQSSGNWQRDNTTPWNKPILVKPLNPAIRKTQSDYLNTMAEMELDSWRREMKKRPPPVINVVNNSNLNKCPVNRKKNRGIKHGYRTRATRGESRDEDDFDNPDNIDSTGSSSSDHSFESSAHEEDSSDSITDSSSEYSDWIADHGLNLEPPKRSKRKPVKKRSVTPPTDSKKKENQRKQKKTITVPSGISEVEEIFRPSEWLTEVIPRKAPYYPQMGDEIVYFRQGHNLYLNAVKNKKVFELGPRCEPWSKMNIKAQVFVKVVGIKYEIRPPRLCCLKLALMDEDLHLTGENFTIKYHDMADVLDFLVLRQTFETALTRNWTDGDRFRCMIDDGWWSGQIESIAPLDEDFPESYFMCFRVRWDNGEYERMSPWDLEPIDEQRLPPEIGGAVPVLPEEIQATLYQPQPEEWPMGDREATSRRILRGIDQVMTLAIAEPFITPVDLNTYPTYAYVVEYPIDLSTIKARLENHFYRRINSVQFDVRYLATNAEKFNKPHSHIVKAARIVTDLCLKIIKESTEIDVSAVYHQLFDTYHSSESEMEFETTFMPSTSRQRSLHNKKLHSHPDNNWDWKLACRQLLETLWLCEDSIPFREPVDRLEHPDYYQIIDTPMDLGTVKEDLIGGNYETPLEFAKDVKLIFTNSKNYNTNKRSKIFSMTIRLSAMFETHIRNIIYNWKSARRRNENSNEKIQKTRTRSDVKNGKVNLDNVAGPSTRKNVISDEEFDDDDDDDEDDNKSNFYSNGNAIAAVDEEEDDEDDEEDDDDDDEDDEEEDEDEDEDENINIGNGNIDINEDSHHSDDNDDDDGDSSNSSDDDSSNTYKNKRKCLKVMPKKSLKKLGNPGPSRINNDYNHESSTSRPKRLRKIRKVRDKVSPKAYVAESDSSLSSDSTDSEPMRRTRTYKNVNSDSSEIYKPRCTKKLTKNYKNKSKKVKTKVKIKLNSVNKVNKINSENNNLNKKIKIKNLKGGKNKQIAGKKPCVKSKKCSEVMKEQNSNKKIKVVSEDDEDDEEDNDDEISDDDSVENKPYNIMSNNSNCNSDSDDSLRPQKRLRNKRQLRHNSDNESINCYTRRNNKRPRYNEQSDEDEEEDDDDDDCSTVPLNTNRNRRKVERHDYAEESDECAPEPGTSVSSRGRVRKMTAKARAFLLESP